MSRWRALIAALCTAMALQAGAAQGWRGTVTRVIDGDTVWVRPAAGGAPMKVRLSGIDAPEICQAGGRASRKALHGRLQGRRLLVQPRGRDDYGRVIAALQLEGEDVGGWMVGRGQAWSYRRGRDGGPYAAQQAAAQAAARGLFADPAAIEPREFRRRHGSCHSAGRWP